MGEFFQPPGNFNAVLIVKSDSSKRLGESTIDRVGRFIFKTKNSLMRRFAMKRTIMALLAMVSLFALIAPMPALAYEAYGKITPNGPFQLFSGIDEFVPLLTVIPSQARRMRAIKAQKFSGKTPANVLSHVVRFRNKLNLWLAKFRLNKTKIFRSPTGETISPAIVY
ncbi:MAG: hypothetical protein V3S64_12520, partial [bacterium]